tara:strand:+ start:91 stop:765 length:675 start_codon:yes stop_codon:yes gene_type:complete
MGLDCLQRERAVTCGRDSTTRVWKIIEETQLLYKGGQVGSMDALTLLSPEHWLTGGEDGSVAMWHGKKKKPVIVSRNVDGQAQEMCQQMNGLTSSPSSPSLTGESNSGASSSGKNRGSKASIVPFEQWITAIAACPLTDLAAVGTSSGKLSFWRAHAARDAENCKLEMVRCVSLQGFVNSIAFSRSGEFVVVGLGQEHRLGRWSRQPHARNCLVIIALPKPNEE